MAEDPDERREAGRGATPLCDIDSRTPTLSWSLGPAHRPFPSSREYLRLPPPGEICCVKLFDGQEGVDGVLGDVGVVLPVESETAEPGLS